MRRCVSVWLGVLAVASLLIAPQPGATAASLPCPADGSLTYGDTATCSLQTSGEVDAFAFDGLAGGVVLVRLSALAPSGSHSSSPRVTIERPGGGVLCSSNSTSAMSSETSCTVAQSGRHRLTIERTSDSVWTGDYNVHLQSTNRPGRAVSLAYGHARNGRITAAAETQAFTIDSSAGDRLIWRVVRTSPDWTPRGRVYGRSGAAVCSEIVTSGGQERSCDLTAAGPTTVLVSDTGAKTGEFTLYVQRTNNPGASVPLVLGEARTEHVETAGELHTFGFEAAQNDAIVVRVASPGGSISSSARLYGANGAFLCGAFAAVGELGENLCLVPQAGRVTVLSGDDGLTRTGGYTLWIQSALRPNGGTTLSMGEGVSASIGKPAEMRTYTFAGTAGDRILARAAKAASTSMQYVVRVYGPDGGPICQASGGEFAEAACATAQGGQHTVVVGGSTIHIGSFGVFLQSSVRPAGARTIEYGRTVEDRLALPGELDSFVVTGAGNQLVVATTTDRVGTGRKTLLRLFAPDGNLVPVVSSARRQSDVPACFRRPTPPVAGRAPRANPDLHARREDPGGVHRPVRRDDGRQRVWRHRHVHGRAHDGSDRGRHDLVHAGLATHGLAREHPHPESRLGDPQGRDGRCRR